MIRGAGNYKKKKMNPLDKKSAAVQQSLQKALQYHSENNLSQAEKIYRKILKSEPKHPTALHLLGVVSLQTGKFDIAVNFITKSLAVHPGHAEAHNNLGLALQMQGRYEESIASFQKALALNPHYVECCVNLGNAFQDQGLLDEAISSFEKVVSIAPGFAEGHNNLGQVLFEAERPEDAVEAYRKAILINPDYPEAYNNLGIALAGLGHFEEAVTNYLKALSYNPDFIEALRGLGMVYEQMGNFKEAQSVYRNIIDINPDLTEAYRYLSHIKKFTENDNDITLMEETYNSSRLNEEQRMHLAYALGKSMEDTGQYKEAFEYFKVGNTIKRKEYEYATEAQEAFFKRLETVFDPSLFIKHADTGSRDETSIFIVGMPRSGTTLVEQILASHPDVHGAGELECLEQIIASSCEGINAQDFPENLCAVDKIFFQDLGREYLEAVRKRAPDVKFITDKMPLNFRFVGFIKLILPNAKVIHTRRNPMDTCLSVFKNYFAGVHEYSYDIVELGNYYNYYSSLMQHWNTVIPDFVYDIQYEDLIADQAGQTRSLLEFCNLKWDDRCLDFHNTKRPVKTASVEQVRRPIYRDSIQSWKRYKDQLQPLKNIIQ